MSKIQRNIKIFAFLLIHSFYKVIRSKISAEARLFTILVYIFLPHAFNASLDLSFRLESSYAFEFSEMLLENFSHQIWASVFFMKLVLKFIKIRLYEISGISSLMRLSKTAKKLTVSHKKRMENPWSHRGGKSLVRNLWKSLWEIRNLVRLRQKYRWKIGNLVR